MLSVRGLGKTFRAAGRGQPHTHALADVALEVAAGSFTAILGPSGSGKTTLLRCIAGFERPDSGTIALDGRVLDGPNARHQPPHARGIGIVPQEAALFPHLSVAQNIAFGLTGMNRQARRVRVEAMLRLVDMPGYGPRRPHQLSGGQQQRVALARALASEPQLVLLDEPFSALDAKLRSDLRDEVRALLRQIGATVVLVTHDQEEALTLADHLVVLRDGHVVADGAPHDLYERPPDVVTAQFLGRATILPARLDRVDGEVVADSEVGRVPVPSWHGPASGMCQLVLRPESIALGPPRTASAVGVVLQIAYRGADALVVVQLASGTTVTASTPGHTPYRAGDVVGIAVLRPPTALPLEGTDATRLDCAAAQPAPAASR
jgi:iron(III) transport system ATP-binding protein